MHLLRLELRYILFIGDGRLRFDFRLRRRPIRQRLHRERRGLRGRSHRNGTKAKSESCFQKITAFHDALLLFHLRGRTIVAPPS